MSLLPDVRGRSAARVLPHTKSINTTALRTEDGLSGVIYDAVVVRPF